MKMVKSTAAAVEFFNNYLKDVDIVLKTVDEVQEATANDIAVNATRSVLNDPAGYRTYILEQRNLAVRALDELGSVLQQETGPNRPGLSLA